MNVTDWDGRSALHVAASAGHKSSVLALIRAGASVEACDRWGRTPREDAELAGMQWGEDVWRKPNVVGDALVSVGEIVNDLTSPWKHQHVVVPTPVKAKAPAPAETPVGSFKAGSRQIVSLSGAGKLSA